MKDFQQRLARDLANTPPAKTAICGQKFDARTGVTQWCNHHFTDCHFSELMLDDVYWSGLIFQNCQLSHLHFKNAVLSDCQFIDCKFTDCLFQEGNCQGWFSQKSDWLNCEFRQVKSQKLTFQGGEWQAVLLQECDSQHWNLINMQVTGLQVKGGWARDWNLCQSALSDCTWQETTLLRQVAGECQLSGVTLKDLSGLAPVWFACLWQQSDLSNLTLIGGSFHRNRFEACDLSASRFTGTVMCEAILQQCRLDSSRFERIQGQKMALHACSLTQSDWSHASLQQASFSQCVGENARFTSADLRGAQLTDLPASADFTQAKLHGATPASLAKCQSADPLLDAIANWYANQQPGPSNTRSALMTTGASRYV
jgi:uncharacterized protein YjbI with pentapeptide repeats